VPEAFSTILSRPHDFGYLVGVQLPHGKAPAPEAVLARLDARELAVARSLTGYRHVEWVGGRLAARIAGGHFGVTDWAVLSGASREPLPPRGFSVSIAHKRNLAIALVAKTDGLGIGVDLEDDVAAVRASADIVLSPEERAAFVALPDLQRDRAIVLAFALKEAAYKALAIRFGRALAYRDARVDVLPDGTPTITMLLDDIDFNPVLEVAHEWREGQVIAAVRVPSRTPRQTPSSSAR
jgi:4'-phosphopantetheinyl transferase EntD